MIKYKDITIHCGSDAIAIAELVRIENACSIPEFGYSEELEKMYEPDDKMAHILVTIEGLPQAVLLAWVNEGNIRVINIVPFKSSVFRIEVGEYNTIIDEFYQKIVRPTIGDKYQITLTSGDYTLQEIIPQSFEALRIWVHSPGAPNAPFSHQFDLERWFEFLSQMTENGETMESGQLEQWLREELNWPEDIIDKTILKYEEEIDLLDYYVNRR